MQGGSLSDGEASAKPCRSDFSRKDEPAEFQKPKRNAKIHKSHQT